MTRAPANMPFALAEWPLWVIRVGLAGPRRLPVYPGQRTSQGRQACLKGATSRHVRAKSAASLPCRLSPSTIRVGGVLLAREQRRLAAIITADVVGYPHVAYQHIYYSSLAPRTYLSVRLLETLD